MSALEGELRLLAAFHRRGGTHRHRVHMHARRPGPVSPTVVWMLAYLIVCELILGTLAVALAHG